MKFSILPLTLVAAFAAGQAQAQQAAAQPSPVQQAINSAQANPTGPLVPGLCIMSQDEVLARSTAGQYADRRLGEISQQTKTELDTARTTAQNDIKALEGRRAALGDEAFVNQASQIEGRFQQLVNLRAAEVQETGNRARNRIFQEATPLIVDSFRARNCSVVFDRAAVVLRADALDITSDVVARLNAKLTQFPIERVQAPAQGAQTPAAASQGARPAAPQGRAR